MKNLFLIVLLGLILGLAACESRYEHTVPRAATTNSRYVACQTEDWLDDANDFISNDRAALAAYFAFGYCYALEYGAHVTVIYDNGRTVKFTYQGMDWYAVRNAVFP